MRSLWEEEEERGRRRREVKDHSFIHSCKSNFGGGGGRR